MVEGAVKQMRCSLLKVIFLTAVFVGLKPSLGEAAGYWKVANVSAKSTGQTKCHFLWQKVPIYSDGKHKRRPFFSEIFASILPDSHLKMTIVPERVSTLKRFERKARKKNWYSLFTSKRVDPRLPSFQYYKQSREPNDSLSSSQEMKTSLSSSQNKKSPSSSSRIKRNSLTSSQDMDNSSISSDMKDSPLQALDFTYSTKGEKSFSASSSAAEQLVHFIGEFDKSIPSEIVTVLKSCLKINVPELNLELLSDFSISTTHEGSDSDQNFFDTLSIVEGKTYADWALFRPNSTIDVKVIPHEHFVVIDIEGEPQLLEEIYSHARRQKIALAKLPFWPSQDATVFYATKLASEKEIADLRTLIEFLKQY